MPSTSLPDAVKPKIRVAPVAIRNDASYVVELMASYGMPLDPWQIDALEAAMGVRPDGTWQVRTAGFNVARQCGKSVCLIARALAGAVLFNEKVIILSAHEQKTSRVLFQNLLAFFDGYADLGRRVKSVSNALGREEIRLTNGAVIFFPARTRSTLRGWSVDLYLADEAQLIQDSAWESVRPAMAARPNSVAWLAGTAPQQSTDGEVFGRLRSRAMAGADDGVAWVEYGADEGCSLDDRAQWLRANPGRVSMDAIEAERRELSPGGFMRERLNIWPTTVTERVITDDQWKSLVGPGPANGIAPSALAVDASREGMWVVAAAWKIGDEKIHVEIVNVDIGDQLLTQQWVEQKVKMNRRIPVVIDGASVAASIAEPLRQQRARVKVTSARDMAAACQTFLSDVKAGRVSHRGQEELDAAVAGARPRALLDAGQWAWNRRDQSVVIAPLVAATLAHHGATTARVSGRAMFA